MNNVIVLLAAIILVSGCSKKKPIEGIRDHVLMAKQKVMLDEKLPELQFAQKTTVAKIKSKWAVNINNHAVFLAGDYWSKPLCNESHLIIANTNGYIICLDRSNGKLLWKKKIAKAGYSKPFVGTGLSMDDRFLFVASPHCELLCLDMLDKGNIVWRYNTVYPMRANPVTVSDKVIATSISGETFCVSKDLGEVIWMHKDNFAGAIIINGARPIVKRNSVIVSCSGGIIFALNVNNGKQLWRANLYESIDTQSSYNMVRHVSANPVVIDNTIVFIGYGGITRGLNVKTGEILWTAPVGGKFAPCQHKDYIFILNEDNMIICLHKNGKIKWTKQMLDYDKYRKSFFSWAGPSIKDDVLYLLSSQGKLIGLQARDGTAIFDRDVGKTMKTPGLIDKDDLFVVSASGNLKAYELLRN